MEPAEDDVHELVLERLEHLHFARGAYGEHYQSFVAMEPRPAPALEPGTDPRPETAGQKASSGGTDLGWLGGEGELHGTYWIEVSPDGTQFAAHATVDADDDGIPAHYVMVNDVVWRVSGPWIR